MKFIHTFPVHQIFRFFFFRFAALQDKNSIGMSIAAKVEFIRVQNHCNALNRNSLVFVSSDFLPRIECFVSRSRSQWRLTFMKNAKQVLIFPPSIVYECNSRKTCVSNFVVTARDDDDTTTANNVVNYDTCCVCAWKINEPIVNEWEQLPYNERTTQ